MDDFSFMGFSLTAAGLPKKQSSRFSCVTKNFERRSTNADYMGRWMTPNCFAAAQDEKAFTELVVRYNQHSFASRSIT